MKKRVLWLLLDSLFLVVFNAAFFLLGGHKNAEASRWISYGAMHLSYLLMAFTPMIMSASRTSKAFGVPISMLSTVYFAVEFVVALIFVLFNPAGWKAAFLIQLVIFAIYAFFVLVALIADASAKEKEAESEDALAYPTRAAAAVKPLSAKVSDPEQNAKIETLYTAITMSPKKSDPSVAALEAEALDRIKALCVAVEKQDAAHIAECADAARDLTERRTMALGIYSTEQPQQPQQPQQPSQQE